MSGFGRKSYSVPSSAQRSCDDEFARNFGRMGLRGLKNPRRVLRATILALQSPICCFSFSIAWSIVKVAGRWLGGNSLNVARNLATTACAPNATYPL